MKKKILAGLLLAGTAAFAAPRFSAEVGFGAPAPGYAAPAYVAPDAYAAAAIPPCPGPGYEFINGYWQFVGAPVVVRDHDDFRRGRDVRVERTHFDRADHGDRGSRFGR